MLSLRLARVRLLEITVHALDRAARLEWSPQQEAELAAYFYLRRIGCTVIARNWKSGRSAGDIDLADTGDFSSDCIEDYSGALNTAC